MKIFNPAHGGELVLPIGRNGEIGNLILGTGVVKKITVEVNADTTYPHCTVHLRIYGKVQRIFAERQELDLTRLLILHDPSGKVGENPEPDTDVLELTDVHNINISVEFITSLTVSGEANEIQTGLHEISISVYRAPESYSNFIYRNMK